MKENQSSGLVLLNKLKQHDLQVQELQYLLKEHQLYNILRKIVTNGMLKNNLYKLIHVLYTYQVVQYGERALHMWGPIF